MTQIDIPIWPEIPPEMMEKLKEVMKQKLPGPVDDAILVDIILTQNKLVEEYLRNHQT